MSIIGIILLIILAFFLIICRIFWAILRPIFAYLYQGVVNGLKKTGMSENAAKAVISAVLLLLILLLVFGII